VLPRSGTSVLQIEQLVFVKNRQRVFAVASAISGWLFASARPLHRLVNVVT